MSQFQHYRRAMGEDDTYRSPEEELLAQRMERERIPFSYEEVKLTYSHVTRTSYRPDFKVATPIGDVLVEVKGFWPHANRQKVKQVVKQLDVRLVMVFMKPGNKLSKQTKTTYAKFCEKNGIAWVDYHTLINAPCLPTVLVEALQSNTTSPAPDAPARTQLSFMTTGTSTASPAPPA